MTTQFVTQAILVTKLSSDNLSKVASPLWTLDADAVSRISEGCNDANSEVDKAISGLGIDVSTVPESLESIAAKIAIEIIFSKTWNPIGVSTPKDMIDAAKEAREELQALKKGDDKIDGTPAGQVVGKFSWSNPGDNPSDNNPRQTVRARMNQLP